MSGEIVSPYPPSLVEAVLASKLCKDKMDDRGAAGLFAVLEVLPYNTPVTRFGCTYHLIRDARGVVVLTQDDVMIAGGNLREIFDAENA